MSSKTLGLRTTMKKVNGDALTPILIFQRIRGRQKFLLESNAKHERNGRYSFIATNPLKSFKGSDNRLEEHVYESGNTYIHEGDIFTTIKRLMPRVAYESDLPLIGGAVGYVGYGAGERKDHRPRKDQDFPDVHLNVYETVIVYDHIKNDVFIFRTEIDIVQRQPDFDALIEEMFHGEVVEEEGFQLDPFQSTMTQQAFESIVKEGKKYIIDGELEQIVLSRQFEADFSGNPFSIYRILRKKNPSPYMYYMEIGDSVIVGASPESLVKVTGPLMMTNPIAGTRPCTENKEENKRLEEELTTDEKELAEHDMLVALSQKEVEKVCSPGTVEVTKYQEVVHYEHVMHLVSEVEGRLAPGQHAIDALLTCLPAGTVSGTPKRKAMARIDQLEQEARGIYGGAIGYIGFNGNIDFALAIRTMVIRNGKAYVRAGAGVVAQSDPTAEFMETEHKAKSLIDKLSYE